MRDTTKSLTFEVRNQNDEVRPFFILHSGFELRTSIHERVGQMNFEFRMKNFELKVMRSQFFIHFAAAPRIGRGFRSSPTFT